MANYYNQFSCVFVPINGTQRDFLRDLIESVNERDDGGQQWAEDNGIADVNELWMHGIDLGEEHEGDTDDEICFTFQSDEEGDISQVAEVIAQAQRLVGDSRPWAAGSAMTCSAPRVDGFGGQAVLVHNGECTHMSTDRWVRIQLAAIDNPATPGEVAPTE